MDPCALRHEVSVSNPYSWIDKEQCRLHTYFARLTSGLSCTKRAERSLSCIP
jgi:hypothetical protein